MNKHQTTTEEEAAKDSEDKEDQVEKKSGERKISPAITATCRGILVEIAHYKRSI